MKAKMITPRNLLLCCIFMLPFVGSNQLTFVEPNQLTFAEPNQLTFVESKKLTFKYYKLLEENLKALSEEFYSGYCFYDHIWAILNRRDLPRCRTLRYYHVEQTRRDYKWCVYADGVPVPYTLEEIKFFPYDCDETMGCIQDNSVFEISGRCEMTCEQANAHQKLNFLFGCKNKCICARGWFRNKAGKCVRKDQCESEKCPAPQRFVQCSSACPATCAVPEPGYCKKPCDKNNNCVCPWDMVLISKNNRECVKRENCPKCESGSMPVDCAPACPDTCPDDIVCKKSGCEKGVFCNCPPGTVRLDRKLPVRCVKPEKCPPLCKSPRVPFETCADDCQPTCDDMNPACTKNCVRKYTCVCPYGQIQRSQSDKKCIKIVDCPPKKECKTPKVPVKCVSKCPKTCDPRIIRCKRNCDEKYACECPKGYLQISKDNTTCVEEKDCPSLCESPKIYNGCPRKCQLTCEHPEPRVCRFGCRSDKCVCPKGMILKDGKSKECVLRTQCPKKCNFPEVPARCRTSCPVTCYSLSRPDTVPVPECREQCKFDGAFCVCAEGYALLDDKCVKVKDCPTPTPDPPVECKAPEVYDSCPTMCPATCQNRKPQSCPEGCNEDKCVCPKGKILLNNVKPKICVDPTECPGTCEDKTHIPIKCPGRCPDTCIREVSFCERDCDADYICGCPEGLVQISHVKTKCVRKKDCPAPCKAPKRYATCASLCQPTCQNQNPGSCRRGCNPNKCVCPRGMVQPDDDTLTCIKPEECRKECEAPKVHVKCASKCQRTCENKTPNIRKCDKTCHEDSCVCPDLLLLVSATNRTCVEPSQCPVAKVPKCEEPKVYTRCASKCPKTCMEPNPRICSRACDVKKLCICPYGMVQRSKEDTTCVKLEDCTVCTKPKIYVNCAPKCRPTCKTPNPVFCKEGCDKSVNCVCPPGMVHPNGQNDNCIKLSACPESCGFLLKPTTCASGCPPTCDDPVPKCDKPCNKNIKCECQLGLLQHSASNRTCLFPSQCPGLQKFCHGRKVPTRCASSCPATCQNQKPGYCKKLCRPKVNCECPAGMVQTSLEDVTCIWPGDCLL